jgi:hypothetical protein
MSRIATSLFSCCLISNLAVAAGGEPIATANQHCPAPIARPSENSRSQLSARGPGALFASIEAAAIDALTHAFLQAQAASDPEFMRGGTIHPVGDGHYSYGETHRAKYSSLHRIHYVLEPQDVARFHLYPVGRNRAVNRINERASRVDLRSVSVVDPLHRPLYILHPSLSIRAYRGKRADSVDVASLHRPAQPQRFAGECSTNQAPSLGALKSENRVAGNPGPRPRK